MKKILFTALAALMLASCYKDESSEAHMDVPTISMLEPVSDISFEVGQQLDWQPVLAFQDGLDLKAFTAADYESYDYWWRMTTSTNAYDTTRVTIATGRALNAVVDMLPTAGNDTYNLALYLKNKATGMEHSLFWSVKVGGVYGGGVLVADTRDGSTSDISLIKSCFYNDTMWDYYTGETQPDVIYRDIYSTVNNGKLAGVIGSMAYSGSAGFPEITAIVPGEHAVRLNPNTMKEEARDGQLFFAPPATWNPQQIFTQQRNMYMATGIINDGKVSYYRGSDRLGKFSLPIDNDANFEAQPGTVVPVYFRSDINALMWDKKNGRVMTLNAAMSPTAKNADVLPPPDAGSLFDPGALSGFDCLYAGHFASLFSYDTWGYDNRTAWVLKDKNNGSLWVYELFTGEIEDPDTWQMVFHVVGKGIYDMSSCPDFDKATCYVTSQDYREFFYAVGGKMYVAILTEGNATPNCYEVYEAPAGETITHMDMDQVNSGSTWYDYIEGTRPWDRGPQNLLMTIATWDGTQGRVRAMPRQWPGEGRFSAPEFWREWDGFGRITAINVRE